MNRQGREKKSSPSLFREGDSDGEVARSEATCYSRVLTDDITISSWTAALFIVSPQLHRQSWDAGACPAHKRGLCQLVQGAMTKIQNQP
jgi:hypothetical protein